MGNRKAPRPWDGSPKPPPPPAPPVKRLQTLGSEPPRGSREPARGGWHFVAMFLLAWAFFVWVQLTLAR